MKISLSIPMYDATVTRLSKIVARTRQFGWLNNVVRWLQITSIAKKTKIRRSFFRFSVFYFFFCQKMCTNELILIDKELRLIDRSNWDFLRELNHRICLASTFEHFSIHLRIISKRTKSKRCFDQNENNSKILTK